MRYYYFSLMLVLFSVVSCGDDTETNNLVAKGGMKYGGTFRFMSAEKITNFLPISTIDVYTQRVNNQIFQTLLSFEKESMKLKPGLAESYTISEDGLIYTFKIRDKVYFHHDECFGTDERILTAKDVKFSLDLACSGLEINEMGYLLMDKIKGAAAFNRATQQKFDQKGVSGITVPDPHTLRIELVEPLMGFDKIMAHTNLAVIAPEAYAKYGDDLASHPIGTGPFIMESFSEDKILLKRNPRYWEIDDFGNRLPFVDKVQVTFSKEKKSELMAFRKGEIDMVLEIPVEETDNILGTLEEAQLGKNIKHKFISENSLSSNYIGFACASSEFSNPKVRSAFHYALDKNELVDKYLQGEGNVNEHGFIPNMTDYPNDKVKGIAFDPVKAVSLLKSAGIKDGKDLGVIDFYVNGLEGSAFHKLALGIRDQLKKNLNVDINVILCTYDEREAAIASGKAKMWRSGWIADYPDPENFMFNFYSKSAKSGTRAMNPFQFKNNLFDEYFDKATREANTEKRNQYWVKCDQIIIDESPVIPVLTDDFIVILNARVRNFESNSMELLDFSSIFIKELKTN